MTKNIVGPHLRFGNDATGKAANPYAMLQKGYKERGRYSATTKVEYIHNLSSVLKGLELRGSVALSKTGYESSDYVTIPYYYYMNPEAGDYDFEKGTHKLTNVNTTRKPRRTLESDGSQAQSTTQWVYNVTLLHTAAWGGAEANKHQTSLTAVFQAQQGSYAPVSNLFSGLEQRNLSYSMRGSYGFLDRYFVEASFGYNGSERFTKNNRMGFFPAAGVAWIASKENFLQGIGNTLSFLKVRASWGKVGNDGIISTPRFVYMQELGKGQDMKDPEVGSNQSFARKMIKNYGDPDVKWEVSEQINLGLETRFFKDKLELNADFYQEIAIMLLSCGEVIPAHVGVEVSPLDNMGKTRSRRCRPVSENTACL